MRVRTFLSILLMVGLTYAMAELAVRNQQVFRQPVMLWGNVSLTVGVLLLLAVLAGIVSTVILGISREMGRLLEAWRSWRERRRVEEIEEEYSRGLVALLEGREEEALSHFRAVLERDSRHFNTLLKLGELFRHQRRYRDAIEYHEKARHLRPDDMRPLYALCEDYEAMGDLDRARAVLDQILARQKQSRAAWRKLRDLHVKAGAWEAALRAQQQLEKLLGSSEAAAADFEIGKGIRYELAKERIEAGRTREGLQLLKRLLRDDSRFIPAHVLSGRAYLNEGQEARALEAWQRGFETTGSPIFLSLLEEHYLGRDHPLAAIEALKRCAAAVEKDTLARFYLGKLYFRLEMLDDAQQVLSSLEGRASYAPTLHYLLGRIHERRKNFAQAAAEYRKVIRELELVELEHHCLACGARFPEWHDRCPECGRWNTVEVAFREEISPEELGLAPAPVYGQPAPPRSS